MNTQEKIKERRKKIKYRIRKKIAGTSERPRLVVFRSLTHVYAQIVDDTTSKTLFSVSSNSKDFLKNNSGKSRIDISKEVGKLLAEKAKSANIEKVVFDRNGYQYHGRVKSVAEGAREGGLIF